MLKYILTFGVILHFLAHNASSDEEDRPKLIIDNDAGSDDAMAIFLALLHETHLNGPQLIALTTGNGNTNEDNVYKNDQIILKVAKRQEAPIYRGAKSSLVFTPESGAYFGQDGLGDTGNVYTDLKPAIDTPAVQALINLSKAHENLSVITIGTLTNVALAIKVDPNFLDRISHLYVAAGHMHGDFQNELEFNAHMDVEAYHIVAQYSKPDKVTYLPCSQVKEHLNISLEWRSDVLGAIETDIIKAQNKFERIALDKLTTWQALDPAAIAVVLNPDLVKEYKYSKVDIGTCGAERGLTKHEFVEKHEANSRVIYSIKLEEYKQFLLDVFSAEQTLK